MGGNVITQQLHRHHGKQRADPLAHLRHRQQFIKQIGVAPQGPDTDLFDELLPVPPVSEWVSPLLTVVPMQLLSYHIAAHRGLDVDQPRNLAKSVTVE